MTSALAQMTSGSGQEVADMTTWGISGPQFLLLYVALFAVTAAVVATARRRALATPEGRTATPARLDPYEAAYLNGGVSLVATTAISGLLRGGLVASTARRGRWVRLSPRTAPAAAAHPVEWAAYQVVAANPGRTLGDLRAALAREPAMTALGERLRRGGLVPSPEQRARYRAAALWFLPLLALGAARVAAGSANGRPVGFLVALLVVTVVVAVGLALQVPQTTELGRRALQQLRLANPRPTGGLAPAEMTMAMALFGAGVLWTADSDTALLLRVPREHSAYGGAGTDGGVGGGCSAGGGGGGGCGGGGCGGGGCGG
jgi:uncharacterized protein (TIGR04222 family)